MSSSLSPLGQTTNNGSQIITLVASAPAVAISYTLSPSQSGAIVTVPTNVAALVTITLPPVQSGVGCNFKVVIKGLVGAGTVVINSGGGAVLQGNSIINAVLTPQLNCTTLTFIEAVVASSNFECYSDGVSWNFKALSNSNLAAAIVRA